ncbi:hypothetical protein FJY84_02310 [Candidatus Bathyarchaeota archaeon]|nr:hypothetical protein [Candidatus Bathyarchaeota archaeon]
MVQKYQKIINYFNGDIAIMCHQNADPDAICSAYALKNLIRKEKPDLNVDLILPNETNKLGKKIIKKYYIEIVTTPRLDYSNIFVVDTGSLNQLKPLDEWIISNKAPKILIDHHVRDSRFTKLFESVLLDEYATSTSEIVYQLYNKMNQIPDNQIANILLCGIAYDSKIFSIGNASTFKIISKLISSGASIYESKKILSSEMELSEKIARLKASQRMKIHRKDKWIIVTAEVSSYQASVARGILNLGADLAIIAGEEKGIIKSSLRSTEKFFKETELVLGGIFTKSLAEEFHGTGGGHSTAAGINVKGSLEMYLESAVNSVSNLLETI